jgi:hypothetical protein
MDAERSGAAMNDAALDRELRALLAVDPSPEFVARVRGRVAAEPMQPAWRGWGMLTYVGRGFSPAAALAAAAAAIAIAVVVSRPPQAPARTAVASHDIGLPPAVVVPPTTQTNRASAAIPVATRRVSAPPVQRTAAPEIVIDPAETRALIWLIRATREGRLDLPAAVRATLPSATDLPAIDPIVIAPLTIDPLNVNGSTAEEGVRP